jgi:hypothetical protein
MNPEDANASMLGKQDIASFCSGIDRIVKTSTLAPVIVMSPDRRRALMGDVVKFKMCEELLPYFTLGYKDSYKGMKGGRQSAAACMRYLVGVTKKAALLEYGIDGANSDDIDAGFSNGSASFRARMDKLPGWETMFFTHSVHQKVKHVVPNDLFETNLLTEILVYTMDAADARKKIEDANPASAAKAVATDDELAAMMAKLMQ